MRDFSFEPSEQGACGQRAHEAGVMKSCCSLKDECHHGGTQEQEVWDTGRGARKEGIEVGEDGEGGLPRVRLG